MKFFLYYGQNKTHIAASSVMAAATSHAFSSPPTLAQGEWLVMATNAGSSVYNAIEFLGKISNVVTTTVTWGIPVIANHTGTTEFWTFGSWVEMPGAELVSPVVDWGVAIRRTLDGTPYRAKLKTMSRTMKFRWSTLGADKWEDVKDFISSYLSDGVEYARVIYLDQGDKRWHHLKGKLILDGFSGEMNAGLSGFELALEVEDENEDLKDPMV